MKAKRGAWKVTKCQELACLLWQTSSMAKAEEGLPASRNSEAVRLLAPCALPVDGGGGGKEKGVVSRSIVFKTLFCHRL